MEKFNSDKVTQMFKADSHTMTQAGQMNYSAQSRVQATELINKIFKSLKAIFPAWASAIKDPEIETQARKEWLMGLVENGITSDSQVAAGLAKCRAHNSPFLPSIGQFVEWCRIAADDLSGLPSEAEALSAMTQELCKPKEIRDWTKHHPAVFLAYSQRQSFDWKSYSYRDLKMAFAETWSDVKKIVREGFNFNIALPKPEDVSARYTEKPISKELAAKKTSEILSMFGVDAEKVYYSNENAKSALEIARERLAKAKSN